VVLLEEYNLDADEFDQDTAKQYRKLCLVDGVYTVEVYRDDVIYQSFQPRANGKLLDRIPFIIAGSYSNDPAVDDAALYDIAEINIGHYRNSADYEEGIFLHGQPMLHIDVGTTSAIEFETLNPNGIEVGSRRGSSNYGRRLGPAITGSIKRCGARSYGAKRRTNGKYWRSHDRIRWSSRNSRSRKNQNMPVITRY